MNGTTTWASVASFVAERAGAYGKDVFLPLPPEFRWDLLDRWLSDTFGFRIDRLSAEYFRQAHDAIELAIRLRGEDEGE